MRHFDCGRLTGVLLPTFQLAVTFPTVRLDRGALRSAAALVVERVMVRWLLNFASDMSDVALGIYAHMLVAFLGL